MGGRLGVCSWSLRPESPADLARSVQACGLTGVQLALDPIRRGDWSLDETRAALADGGISALSGMMEAEGEDYSSLETIRTTGGLRPDATWEANLACAGKNARLAAELGLTLVTFHAGFLPEQEDDPERSVLLDRLRQFADTFAEHGVRIALETGQEQAQNLLAALVDLDRPEVGINFDPANMILYGMGDPVAALTLLAPRVAQVHLKDALPSTTPGQWGSEVPLGEGDVNWDGFFAALAAAPGQPDLVIEREAGESRLADICQARDLASPRLVGQTRQGED